MQKHDSSSSLLDMFVKKCEAGYAQFIFLESERIQLAQHGRIRSFEAGYGHFEAGYVHFDQI